MRKIELNKTGTKKKLRKVKCQELDDLVTKYIVGAESKLSEFGIGLSWGVVQARALKISKELNESETSPIRTPQLRNRRPFSTPPTLL